MASYNRVVLIGNLTRDVELKHTASNVAIAEIGLAVNDRRKGPNGDWIQETTFVDVVAFAGLAEVCNERISKGSPAFVEGRLKYEQWEKDGRKFSKLKVVAEKVQFLAAADKPETKSEPPRGADPASNRAARVADAGRPDEEIPF